MGVRGGNVRGGEGGCEGVKCEGVGEGGCEYWSEGSKRV